MALLGPEGALSSASVVVHGPSGEDSKRVHHHQNIVYAASIHQAKLHSDINDGDLLHQGFLWKKRDDAEAEIRYWALLFSDALLLTHVTNNVQSNDAAPPLVDLFLIAKTTSDFLKLFFVRFSFFIFKGEQWRAFRGRRTYRNEQHRPSSFCQQ